MQPADIARRQEIALELKELELRERQALLERQQIENALLKLQVMEKASDLVKQGIIIADPVEIVIDGYPFLSLKDGVAQRGVDPGELASPDHPDANTTP